MRNPPADLRLYYVQQPTPAIPAARNIQTYFPSLEILFPSLVDETGGAPVLAAAELAVDVSAGVGPGSTPVATVEHIVTKQQRQVPVWIRPMHLVEPLNYLEKEYILPADGALPASRGPWQRALRKINDPYNEAYTDAVFACMASRLVETGRSPHWCRFYGTYNGRLNEYRYNITDDMPDIEDEDWFHEGLKRGLFSIVVEDIDNPSVSSAFQPARGSRSKKPIDGDAGSTHESMSSVESLESDEERAGTGTNDDGALEEADIELSNERAEVRQPRVRLSRALTGSSGSSAGSAGDDDDEGESSYDGLVYKAVFKDFPAQLTLIERCDGTMDDLMEEEISEEASPDMRDTKEQRWTAWIFQVVAALATAQQAYDFVHNDLHTNNVMWCGTGETHLYYHVTGGAGGDRYYKVPTYGRIFKIIDFGRATFRPPAIGVKNQLWIPDAYAPGADAGGQYNCGQYFEQGRPKVQPNKSFDLCRLAVAILDTLWEEEPAEATPRKVLTREPGRVQAETASPLWNILWLWLTDKDGKNVLRNPENRERYPEFDLYCAIARDVHNAVPAQQLTLPLFDGSFRCRRKDVPTDATVWKLHAVSR
jgi:hypothetical protein